MWWETLPAQITLWAGALAALFYLLKMLVGGAGWVRRLLLALHLLGDTKQYPNGSTDLLTALTSIYKKQTELGETQTALNNKQATMTATQTQLLGEVKSLAQSLEQHQLNGHR